MKKRETDRDEKGRQAGACLTRLLTPLVIAVLAAVLYWQFGSWLSLSKLAEQETALKAFQRERPLLVYLLAFAVYVLVTGLSLPGATGLTLLYGWFFGFLHGLVLVSFASTTGATLAFLLSRFLFRDIVERKYGDRLQAFRQAWEKEGAFYLFSLRLIPLVPFFVINLVMGLTPVAARTFWWVSQIGMAPGTCVYVYAGSAVPSLRTLAEKGLSAVIQPSTLTQITIAFTLLGLAPWMLKILLAWFHKKYAPTASSHTVT